jgi:hypothetical protein
MRAIHSAMTALALVACAPPATQSMGGVGFQDYDSYIANRQAMLAQPLSEGAGVLPEAAPSGGAFSVTGAAAAISNAQTGAVPGAMGQGGAANPLAPRSLQEQAAALGNMGGVGQGAAPQILPQTLPEGGRLIGSEPMPTVAGAYAPSDAVRPRGNAPAGIAETVSEMAVLGGVSDEQDFEAVAARETIESDRARIERNRAQYQIDQPGALPQREGVGPSVVEYALATQHPVGVKLFRRSPLRFKKIEVACAPYANDDLAQEAFLAAGGPKRDRMGMDPDGDGFACGWDPSPYRAVLP